MMSSGVKTEEKKAIHALPVGQLLHRGRYRIVRVLGGGGYGITYEALDQQMRQRVAIKEFFPTHACQRSSNGVDVIHRHKNMAEAVDHARMRFNEEALLLLSLKNVKEIVNVYRSFEDNQTAYYTMELLHGMDMQQWLRSNGRMVWQELSPIVIQIIRAIYATHQKGYIHRDVTPDNIFLLNNGTVQLIDFGNARRFRDNPQMTAVLKDKFAPREQYGLQGRQGPWTDIYSLCVTIYYAMTGVLPKKATERNSEADTLPPLQTVASVPAEVSNAIQIGMSADENRRYQSIADFAYAMYPKQDILAAMIRKIAAQQANHTGQMQFASQKQIQTQPVQPNGIQPKSPAPVPQQGQEGLHPVLICTQGIMRGFRVHLPVEQIQTLGRGQGKTIQYPVDSVGISRNQCSVLLKANGVVYIRDDQSSYGTTVNGRRLPPGGWQPLKCGEIVAFGRETYILYLS